MLTAIRAALSGPDNHTINAALALTAAATVVFIINSLVSLLALGQPWDPSAFGMGFAALVGTGGLGSWLTRHTYPESTHDA